MSPGRHKKQLTVPPSPAHTSPPRILVTQSPENTGLQASDSTDDSLTQIFSYWDSLSVSASLSATGCKKARIGAYTFSYLKLVGRMVLRSLSRLSPPVPLSPSWKLASLCGSFCASATAVALLCLQRTYEGKWGREREGESKGEGGSGCVCVLVWVRVCVRERERLLTWD